MKKSVIFLLMALFISAVSVNAAKKVAPQDSIRILFVGNSFTYVNDMPAMFDSIAVTQKKPVSITRVVKGGERFSGHLKNKRLIELLKKGGWNFVVLQDQSSDPAMPTREVVAETYKNAHTLDSLAKAGSPKVKVVFYMTWGHKYGCRTPKAGYPIIDTYKGMQMRLVTSYLEMAYENNSICAPVGLAWEQIREKHPEYVLYRPDAYHPSVLGSYLAANVIYATIFPKPYQTSYTAGFSPEVAEVIQQTAQETVFSNKKIINLELNKEEPSDNIVK